MKFRPSIFHFLGGKCALPKLPSLVQTDGSFTQRRGRIAILLNHQSNLYTKVQTIQNPKDSYEMEWASVYHGLLFTIQKDIQNICIENDNQGVVSNLISGQTKRNHKTFVNDYREAIYDLAKQTEWTGIRWIPRAYNRADDLFHSKKTKQ